MVEQNEERSDKAAVPAEDELHDHSGHTEDQDQNGHEPSSEAVSDAAEASPAPEASEDESEIAADYLEELLDIADLDGDIDIEVRQNRAYLSVVTEENEDDLELLVGRRGEVLDALQELVRLSVLASTGQRSRLILDIAGYRDRRGDELEKMAKEAIASVQESGDACHLKPLSAYERKIVHDLVAENGLHSESEGEGSKRHIVVSMKSEAHDDAEAAH
ncbi:Jag family protein [Rothia uropygialis]|uniref:Jag family protein n=1 Tax=Kocuria sp. 36 TaxID=1415402 RepID=UPI00101BCB23|nr:R3H domain-containing nucleic acid-binding protein [Kocuria sp. 36]